MTRFFNKHMAASRIVFLMYHELELAGRKLCRSEPGYVRYILPLETFRAPNGVDEKLRLERPERGRSSSLSCPAECLYHL